MNPRTRRMETASCRVSRKKVHEQKFRGVAAVIDDRSDDVRTIEELSATAVVIFELVVQIERMTRHQREDPAQ